MKCTSCGNDMVRSHAGWLCLFCGHVKPHGGSKSAPVPDNSASSDRADSAPAAQGANPAPAAPGASPAPPASAVFPAPAPAAGTIAMPSTLSGSGAAVPAVPPATVFPRSGKPPLTPETHPRSISVKIVLIIIGAVLVLCAVALVVYLYFISPKTALGGYLIRLASAKTSVFATTTSVTSEGTQVSLSLGGKYDLKNEDRPKLETSVKGKLSAQSGVITPTGGSSSGSVSGQLQLNNNILYFKIESFSMLSDLLNVKISNDWYKYDLGTAEQSNKCSSNSKDSGSFLGSQVLTSFPVKNTKLVGLDTFNGTKALHYSGLIDNSKIKAAIDNANKNLSADCKLDISEDSYKNLSISYELWRGWSKDRIKFTVVDSTNKTNYEVLLDTSAYGKPVTINPPANAKDASQLWNDVANQYSDGSSAAGEEVATGGTAEQRARDVQRKTDLTALRKGLEEHFVNNNEYPKTLAELTKNTGTIPQMMKAIPADPTNKSPFVYTYSLSKDGVTYTLNACLENAADTTTNVIAPIPPCKTKTFELLNAN